MNSNWIREREQFAIARWPRFAGLNRGPFHFADRDHLSCVRFGQFATAGDSAASTDLAKISPHFLFCFCHRCPSSMHHKRLMMQEAKPRETSRSAEARVHATVRRGARLGRVPFSI